MLDIWQSNALLNLKTAHQSKVNSNARAGRTQDCELTGAQTLRERKDSRTPHRISHVQILYLKESISGPEIMFWIKRMEGRVWYQINFYRRKACKWPRRRWNTKSKNVVSDLLL